MSFSSREEAGQQLGNHLAQRGIEPDLVVGLPRGGVVVAAEVARILGRPLQALAVRKIGHPRHREFAVGALAEPDVTLLDQFVMRESPMMRAELDEVLMEERQQLNASRIKFHQPDEPTLAGKTVVIVDDGLATGATAEAAVISVKNQRARQVIVAVPVASPEAMKRLNAVADEVVVLIEDSSFVAVGQYYEQFAQTSDEEVLALLHAHA